MAKKTKDPEVLEQPAPIKAQEMLLEKPPTQVVTALKNRATDIELSGKWDRPKYATALAYLHGIYTGVQWLAGEIMEHWAVNDEEGYTQYIRDIGWSNTTINAYRNVVAKVPSEIRQPKLSFSHHEAVASISVPEQEHWLKAALENDWDRDRFREELREAGVVKKRLTTGSKKDRTEEVRKEMEDYATDVKVIMEWLEDEKIPLSGAAEKAYDVVSGKTQKILGTLM